MEEKLFLLFKEPSGTLSILSQDFYGTGYLTRAFILIL